MWSYVDAINLALDALNAHEITLDQLDQYTNELWHDMAEQNEAEQGCTNYEEEGGTMQEVTYRVKSE